MLRSASDLAKMRKAGRVVAEMHACIRAAIRPGVTTLELDRIGRDVLERRGARSNFLGYGNPPFTGVICASPNDVIVHGIPGPLRLEEGDIISIDCGAIVEGWHGDAAFTTGVGAIDDDDRRLIEATEASLAAGIAAMQPGGRLSDIGAAVQRAAEAAGFSVVKEYTGHGIGMAMHEAPDVPNWGRPGKGRRLAPGQTYAVEPMVCAGSARTHVLDDDWTVVTADGSRAAHTEHTIAITEAGPEILTRP
jgi:methionyl aminopeptidase